MIIKDIKKQLRISKNTGKPYLSVAVKFEDYVNSKGEMVWISGFGNKRTWYWNVGDDVQPEIIKKGKYLNFSFDDSDENRLSLNDVNVNFGALIDLLEFHGLLGNKEVKNEPKEESSDNIPF